MILCLKSYQCKGVLTNNVLLFNTPLILLIIYHYFYIHMPMVGYIEDILVYNKLLSVIRTHTTHTTTATVTATATTFTTKMLLQLLHSYIKGVVSYILYFNDMYYVLL